MRALPYAAALVLVVGCSKPQAPTLAPKRVMVTSVSPTAIGLDVTLDATNPNAIDIPTGALSAHVIINKTIEVGATTVDQKLNLPANQTTELDVAVSVPFADVLPLAALATSDQRTFPYSVDGEVALGGELLHVTVPFHLEGRVSREQIVRATLAGIPQIPGVTAPATASGGMPIPLPAPSIPGRRVAPRTPK
jgi:LEA14-like dessication related protein